MSELKTALVTGATSGIGRAFAACLARDGWSLVLVGRDEEGLDRARKELSTRTVAGVRTVAADLTLPGTPTRLIADLAAASVPVDLLVNAAGTADAGLFATSDWETQASMLRVHVMALTQLTHLVLPQMIAHRRGWILNVASTAALRPGPLMAVYSAAKAYVVSLSEALASELAGTGVSVTALCPGPTRTNFQARTSWRGVRSGNWTKLAEPEAVAAFGYAALLRGQRVAIYGRSNQMLAVAMRFLPRDLQTALVHRARRPRPSGSAAVGEGSPR